MLLTFKARYDLAPPPPPFTSKTYYIIEYLTCQEPRTTSNQNLYKVPRMHTKTIGTLDSNEKQIWSISKKAQ